MKVAIPDNYPEYINTDVYVLRKTINSLVVFNSFDKEIIDNNLKKQKPPSENFITFMMNSIVKLHTTKGILNLSDKLLSNANVTFAKDKLGIIITENKR